MLSEPRQLKAARALIGWSQDVLAVKSKVSVVTIRRQEALEEFSCGVPILHKLQRSLESAGIEFLNHKQPGVRLVKNMR
jgi:transcriptional regulator with XRE-family HTH domain